MAERKQATPTEQLEHLMSCISERCWCAEWLDATEHILWKAVTDGPMPWGLGLITEQDISELRRLAEASGGWIIWKDGAPDTEFIPIEQWLRTYCPPSGDTLA